MNSYGTPLKNVKGKGVSVLGLKLCMQLQIQLAAIGEICVFFELFEVFSLIPNYVKAACV